MTESRTSPQEAGRTGNLLEGMLVTLVVGSVVFWMAALATELNPMTYAVVLVVVGAAVGVVLVARGHVAAGAGVVAGAVVAPWVNLAALAVMVGS